MPDYLEMHDFRFARLDWQKLSKGNLFIPYCGSEVFHEGDFGAIGPKDRDAVQMVWRVKIGQFIGFIVEEKRRNVARDITRPSPQKFFIVNGC